MNKHNEFDKIIDDDLTFDARFAAGVVQIILTLPWRALFFTFAFVFIVFESLALAAEYFGAFAAKRVFDPYVPFCVTQWCFGEAFRSPWRTRR